MNNFNFSEKVLGLISTPHFVYDFSRKIFHMLHSINSPNSIVWFSLLLEILANMCITIVCEPGCDVMKFEINLIFLSSYFATWPKSQDKIINILRMKELLKWNKKYFSSLLNGFQLPKIVLHLRVRL